MGHCGGPCGRIGSPPTASVCWSHKAVARPSRASRTCGLPVQAPVRASADPAIVHADPEAVAADVREGAELDRALGGDVLGVDEADERLPSELFDVALVGLGNFLGDWLFWVGIEPREVHGSGSFLNRTFVLG